MDEAVQIAVLELHGKIEPVDKGGGSLAHGPDDVLAVLNIPLMVVGHLKHEQRLGKGLHTDDSSFTREDGQRCLPSPRRAKKETDFPVPPRRGHPAR